MKSGLAGLITSLALGGLVVAGAINATGCDDDDTATGAAGNTGRTVVGTFSGLSSAATVAHLHGPASATTTADPILDLSVSTDTSGIVTGGGQLTTSQATDMRNGMTYINIHSSMHMAGEIRAQIQ